MTRWKLLAGGLIVSLGGLAAVADVPSRSGISCASKSPVSAAKPLPTKAVGEPVPIPAIPEPAIQLPALPTAPPTPAPTPLLPLVPAVPEPAAPTSQIPNMVVPADSPVIPLIPLIAATETAPMPRSIAVIEYSVPLLPAFEPPVVTQQLPMPQLGATQPLTAPPPPSPVDFPTPQASLPSDPQPATRAPQPIAQAPVEQLASPVRVEKKLKVLLHMSDERPRFEVKDAEETYLKVVSDRVEVKSPSETGAMLSTVKAGGRVTFVTPGGEGTCDELTVTPGTGQVVVSGKVLFTYSWGKIETTVSGERMTFRLGTAATMMPATPATTAVPTSYSR